MLNIYGIRDNSAEYNAAEQLAEIACNAIPDLERNNRVFLSLFPHTQCYGQSPQDVDVLVLFADYRDVKQKLVTSNKARIHSFCTTVEVKDTRPEDTEFDGNKCIVYYNKKAHNASSQSEGQKYSVRNYIQKHIKSSPFITNVIWLRQLPQNKIPPNHNNCLSGESIWNDFLDKIALLHNRPSIESFNSEYFFKSVCEIFNKKIKSTSLDRKKMEIISKKAFDREHHQYAQKLGEQLLVFKGRGGTGKTVKLIRAAYQAYDELGLRVIILTYNKSLVCDLTRLLTLLKVKNSIGDKGMAIKTIHSFMYQWLTTLGMVDAKRSDFLEMYEAHKQKAINYINEGAVNKGDLEKAKNRERDNSQNLAWDLIFIDEAQDWPETERELLYTLYGYKNIILADGVDQFVRGIEKIDWRENINKANSQIISLTKSLRLKSSLCKVVSYFAEEIEYLNWNLVPQPEAYGGRVIVVTGNVFSRNLYDEISTQTTQDGNRIIDMLFCIPPTWVITDREDINSDEGNEEEEVPALYSKVAVQFEEWGLEVWDAANPEQRDEYPTSCNQHRIVQYESCRGLEGWVVMNYAIDEFFEHKRLKAEISEESKADMFYEEEEEALDYAKRWIMIPLTRAIDTLVLHISQPDSYIGKAMQELYARHPESIEWRHYD